MYSKVRLAPAEFIFAQVIQVCEWNRNLRGSTNKPLSNAAFYYKTAHDAAKLAQYAASTYVFQFIVLGQ
jgi:hypothetical protein